MGTCFGPKEEQIYMLELLVDHIHLNPDKLKEVGTTPLGVQLKFIDFPIFEIGQDDFVASKRKQEKVLTTNVQQKNDDGSIDFSTGKSCLFSKQPRELVQAMRTRPMKVSIHKVISKKNCGPEEEVPICGTQVPLSGCLCDQVAMAMNDVDRLPKPYTIKNTYNMVDSRGKPSGTIAIFLRLSCYGKSIVTHFAVQDKLLLFKTVQSMKEFQCTRVCPKEEELAERKKIAENNICVPDGYKEPETKPTPKVETIMSLIPVCEELVEKDQCSKNITVPKPHQSDIKDGLIPDIITLGKKLLKDHNKGNFLDLADQSDPSCVCQPGGTFLRSYTGDFPCTGANCAGGLCIGTRLLDPFPRNYDGGTETMPCYTGSCCSGSLQSGGSGCCSSKRRLRGGGEEKSGTSCGLGQIQTKKTTEKAKTCKICTQKPCKGVDCLIQAFKKTQEFVDSIGKVPGMAGLGLMDPSESPYFGRERDYKQNICPSTKNLSDPAPQHQSYLTSISPLSRSSPTPTKSSVKRNNSAHIAGSNAVLGHTVAPTGIPVNPRPGREFTAHLTDHSHLTLTKTKKKEEKIERQKEQEMSLYMQPEFEKGPCGEVKCKSRRKKKVQDEIGSDQSIPGLSLPKKPLPSQKLLNNLPLKSSNRGKLSYKNKHHNPKHRIHYQGLTGDRSRTTSYIKVSKRVMKAVEAARKILPGIHYGHKNCVDMRMRVPANMGWLWNSFDTPGRLKPRLGWRPGAISKYLYNLMMEVKAGSGSTSESRPATPTKSKKIKAIKSKSFQSVGRIQRIKKKEGENDEIEFPPTLHVHRKDGTYYVTMYPIKSQDAEDSTVQEPVKPLQFKITKNKDDASVCSSSSASDMEIEFSPPAAISRYCKKPDQVHIDTQVKQQDILDAFKPAPSSRQDKTKKGDKVGKGTDNKEKKGKGKK